MDDAELVDISERKLCHDCVGETHLSGQIESAGRVAVCSYCGETAPCYDIEEICDVIEGAFERHYVRTSDQPTTYQYAMLSDKESDYFWERDGEPVVYAIMGAAEIPEKAARDIQGLLEERHGDIEAAQMGEETEFDSDSYYEEKGADDSYWREEWERFERSLKTEARFFSQEAAKHLAAVFDGIEDMRTWNGKPIVVEAGPGTALPALYRARAFQSDIKLRAALARPDLHLGSPPPDQAAAGRMNARGISVFYGANGAEVALAEVRPPVGCQVAVARFEVIRPLRLLDLAALSSASVEGSIFDADYARRCERAAFFHDLTQRMTKPVMPDDEVFEYLPTQAVADFLATRSPAIDGIIYPSVQTAEGAVNIVLFHKAALVAEIDLPQGIEIDPRLGMHGEDGWERDYVVSETVPVPVASPTKEDRVDLDSPVDFGALLRPFPGLSTWNPDGREPALKIDLISIEVRVVEKAEFKTENHSVRRYRWEKRPGDAF